MRIGVHVSIAGNICESLERARALGCDTMQIFSRNPRGWKASALAGGDIKEFRRLKLKYGIRPVAVHIPYIINLATPDDVLYKRSVSSYIEDIGRSDALSAEYFVTHLGSHVGSGPEAGIRRFSDAMNIILKKARPEAMILLENTAGAGAMIGSRFEDIRSIMDNIDDPSGLGVCLDTAHAFEAGYDIKTQSGLEKTLKEFDRIIGLDRIKVVHFNDSLTPFGSHVDRHQDIGKGRIGREALGRVINHPGLKDAAFIMETPKESDKDDKRNLAVVRKLIKD